MTYLGLDLGSKTLGVAKSDATGTIASAYQVINHQKEYDRLVEDVIHLVEQLHVDAIVLGFPKNMNNTVGEKACLSIEFQEKLSKKLSIPIYLQDERLTTKQAEDTLITFNTSRKKRKKVIDALAATIILQSFLDQKGR